MRNRDESRTESAEMKFLWSVKECPGPKSRNKTGAADKLNK
jgi:hypothetical protein